MSNLAETLFSLVELLDSNSIPYAVMGGVAVRAHGVPRPTYDIDLNVTIDRHKLQQLFERLREIDYTIPELYKKGWFDDVKGLKVLKLRRYVGSESLDVDLFLTESEFQRAVMQRRVQSEAEGHQVWLVTPEDLILFKILAGRPRDLGDVQDVLFMQGQLDESYMRRWAIQLGIEDKLEQALAEQL